MKEAEALKARLEREKQELRDYIEKDNKALQEKMDKEEEDRRKKEAELKDRLKEQQQASENEVIQLYKKMANENRDRKMEIDELRDKLNAEKEEMRLKLEQEKEDLRNKLMKENMDLKNKLENQNKNLSDQMDNSNNNHTSRINDLSSKLAKMNKDSDNTLSDLRSQFYNNIHSLRNSISKPLSVLFDAFRTEDYDEGGEGYLTFQGLQVNLGGGMDTKSGVFTAPFPGVYSFTIHVCTADHNKALLSLRHNGNQVASFYDQNHESNHKNSMVGQSIIVDLEIGDKIQVYLYTNTGLMDKKNNHLTHFTGMYLRPKNFMLDEEGPSLTNGSG
ncbi:uncharacterized protein [Lepeophtheirus salmonis]|uniref:uncharacterized protein n=1 Tax=Lepeophtheirus salmonis TaxID=72036 RepID=UPI001AE13BCD|nr:myosin-2 heavy chain, non muscle-like [Lepeophtheirus salmonis]